MRKRYIVALNSSTKQQNDAFLEFIKENRLGWWYWVKDFWLLVDSSGKLSAKEVREALGETHPRVNNIVIELNDNGDTWSGHGPKSRDRNMFKWLQNTWGKHK